MFVQSADVRGRFYRNFASLVNAGVPIIEALESLRAGLKTRDHQEYESFLNAVRSGQPIHRAMAHFASLDRALVKVGETNGTLVDTLRYLASYYDERHVIGRNLKNALGKPAFLIVTSIFLRDLPKLVGGELTLALYFLRAIVPLTVLAIIAFFLIQITSRTDGSFLLPIPWLGPKVQRFSLERFFLCLELGIRSGCSIDTSLDLASSMINNADLKRAVAQTRARQTKLGFANALAQTRAFDERYIADLRTGEQTGQLDETCHRIRNDLREQNLETIEQLKEWMPKIIYLLAAVYVAWGIVQSFTAIMNQAFSRLP